jgi:hypothetical protein
MKSFPIVKKHVSVLLVLWMMASLEGVSQQGTWRPLGSGRTSEANTSTYIVAEGLSQTVCAIRFEVTGESLGLNEVTVHFSNSQSMHLIRHSEVGNNSVSPTFTLPGVRRQVKGVELVYSRQVGAGGGSSIKVWGEVLPGEGDCPR